MKILDKIIRSYSSTIKFPYLARKFKIDSIWRHILIYYANYQFNKIAKKETTLHNSKRNSIVVSLTSFPSRIDKVWMTIETLLNQSLPPDKIILWLSKNQFKSIDDVPDNLKKQQHRGLEIRIVPEDYRSHKKYLYAFKEYSQSYVVLVDDDILYPSNMIERLYKNITPDCVHCSYCNRMYWDKAGKLMPYNMWDSVYDISEDSDLFFGSGGGTMLMPERLPKICLNIDLAISLCPTADDIWLNTMCRLAGLKIVKVRDELIFPIINKKTETLCQQNVRAGQNDIQLKNIIKQYPNVFDRQ